MIPMTPYANTGHRRHHSTRAAAGPLTHSCGLDITTVSGGSKDFLYWHSLNGSMVFGHRHGAEWWQ